MRLMSTLNDEFREPMFVGQQCWMLGFIGYYGMDKSTAHPENPGGIDERLKLIQDPRDSPTVFYASDLLGETTRLYQPDQNKQCRMHFQLIHLQDLKRASPLNCEESVSNKQLFERFYPRTRSDLRPK